MAQPVIVQATRIFFVDLVGGLLGFPVWWYTKGVVRWSKFMWGWFSGYRASLAVAVWVKNIFVPMYGSYDIVGRLISFFMRVAMIIIRSLLLVFIAVFMLVFYLVYFALPPLVVAAILYHGIGLFGDLPR